MKFVTPAAVSALALCALGLTACAGQSPGKEAAVADPRFDRAANFSCDGGGMLDLVFNQAEGAVLARVDGGAALTLAPDAASEQGMTWTDGTARLVLGGGEGATWTADGASRTCRFESRALPAPTAEGVTQTLTIADAGRTVEVNVGDKVAVALSGVPTAGYVWGAANPPAWVKASEGPGGATTTAQFLPGFAGGNHWEVVIIEAVAAGQGEITLAQRRPWEDAADPDATTFVFTLRAS